WAPRARGHPAESFCSFLVTLRQRLVRIRTRLVLIALGVVAAAELERIELELARARVHRALETQRALRVTRRAQTRPPRRVDVRERLDGADVRAPVQFVVNAPGAAKPPSSAERDVCLELDCGEGSVALCAEHHPLCRRGPIAGVSLFALAIEHATNRSPELA